MAQREFTANSARGPAVWKDKSGITHRAEGDQMVPGDRGTFILWTICGKHDIPANAAHIGDLSEIDCQNCMIYPNGAPMFSPDGMMLDDEGNRSIFDDIDEE